MPLYVSPFKVTHGSTVMVTLEDNLTTWPELSGGFLAPSVDRVNATGQKAFPRANEFNSIDLGWMRQYETPWAAELAKLRFPSTVPRTRANLVFQSEDGTNFTLADAVLPAWSARAEGCNVYFTLTAKGGVIT